MFRLSLISSQTIKGTTREIKSAGINLNKIWAFMSTLRQEIADITISETSATGSQVSDVETPLTFPNPSSPPVSSIANARPLRSVRQVEDSVNIVYSMQMIPVITSLIHSALETSIIREDIEQSMKDSRDFARDAKEATRLENERWEKVKIGMENPQKSKAQTNEVRISACSYILVILIFSILFFRTKQSVLSIKIRSQTSIIP